MKLSISLFFTAIMQPVVGQGYDDGFEFLGNGICEHNNNLLSVISGFTEREDCFEQCSNNEWCLGISIEIIGEGIWCELNTSNHIACADPPISIPGFGTACLDIWNECDASLSECSITGFSANGYHCSGPNWECWRKITIAPMATMLPTSTPSVSPTITEAGQFEWDISILRDANYSNVESAVGMAFNISNQYYTIDILDSDCITKVEDALHLTETVIGLGDGFKEVDISLDINQTLIEGSNSKICTSGGEVEFCIVASLFLTSAEEIIISSLETTVQVKIDTVDCGKIVERSEDEWESRKVQAEESDNADGTFALKISLENVNDDSDGYVKKSCTYVILVISYVFFATW